MKNRLFQFVWAFALPFIFHTTLNAQNHSSSTNWLKLKFGEAEAMTMIEAGGEKLELYLFIAENGLQVHDVAPKDISEYPDALLLSPVHPDVAPLTEADLLQGNFNAELYTFERADSTPTYYRIGDTSHLVIIESYQHLRTKFQNEQ